MKKIIICLIALSCLFVDGIKAKDTSSVRRPLVMLASVQFGHGATGLSQSKIEAAFSYAVILSSKFDYITPGKRDSVAETIRAKGTEPTAIDVAKAFSAEKLYFVKISRIKNMLRAEVIWRDTSSKGELHIGVGYSLLNYRNVKSGEALYDPTLLSAIQRGIAVAEKDSNMYKGIGGKLEVYPAKTVVPGALIFVDSLNIKPSWALFSKKEINSYSAAEAMFEAASKSSQYVTYDIESRDSIFTIFNLYSVENFNAPSNLELDALSKFGVDSYLAGYIARVDSGAVLEISLFNLDKGTLHHVRSARGFVAFDDVVTFDNEVSRLTHELFSLKYVPVKSKLENQIKKDKKASKKTKKAVKSKKK